MLFLLIACRDNIGVRDAGAGLGEACVASEDCLNDLACAQDATCQPEGSPGTYGVDEECVHTEECGVGLVCGHEGTCAQPGAPGTGTDGSTCVGDEDCALGWYCDAGVCTDLEVPYWAGEECPPDDTEGPFQVRFDVPDLPMYEGEFFSMPFPTDIRLDSTSHPDLSGFPSPGGPVDALVAAVQTDTIGWGLNTTVFFHANNDLDTSSVRAFSDDDTIFFASIDPEDDDYGLRESFAWKTATGRNRYLCDNWVAVSVFPGVPLEPNTTYAVWLTTGVRSADGENAEQSPDFSVVMGDVRPGGDGEYRLVPAWDSYAPFRAFLDSEGIPRSDVAAAAVFTTGDPTWNFDDVSTRLDTEAVDGTPITLESCEEAACGGCTADPALRELHGTVRRPIYGDATGSWGWEGISKMPYVRSWEEACFAVTLPPEGEGPFPVVILSQDQGAGLRDFVDNGVAQALAQAGFAAISMPSAVTFDLQNPAGTLGSRLQSAADLHLLQRVARSGALAVDPDDIHLLGHGEGARVALPFLATERRVHSAALAGLSGWTAVELLETERPTPMAYEIWRTFADNKVDRFHPAMALLQQYLEASDPTIWGDEVWEHPSVGTSAKHVMHLYGVGDTWTGAQSQQAAQTVLGLPTVGTLIDDFGQPTGSLPASRNVLSYDGLRYTAASVQVEGGRDALFDAANLARVTGYFSSAVAGADPVIK